MYSLLVQMHSYLRYFLLFLLLFLIIRSFYYWQKRLPYNTQTNIIGLYLLICTHLQLVLGLILYFISPYVSLTNFSSAMKDKVQRFFTVEHASIMLLAIILITVARIGARRLQTDEAKHKRLFFLNTLALILILGGIPWPFREAIGQGRHLLFHFF